MFDYSFNKSLFLLYDKIFDNSGCFKGAINTRQRKTLHFGVRSGIGSLILFEDSCDLVL